MIPALDRTRALLDTPAPEPIPGQLDLTRSEPMTNTDTYYERLDISEALESAGWIADHDNPLDILRKNGATFAITNDCGDSGVSHADGWGIDFPSDVPDLEKAAARVTELETEVVRLRTTPAEHCGNQKPPFSEHTQRTECVLRPHHHGSHADEHGTRWWRIDDRPTTA